MKKKLAFCFLIFAMLIPGCVKNVYPTGGGDPEEIRFTVTKSEWDNIFVPNNFVFNNELTFYVEDARAFCSVNHGKVRIDIKKIADGNIEHEFRYYEYPEYPEYNGYYAEFIGIGLSSSVDDGSFTEVEHPWLVSTLDFTCFILSESIRRSDETRGFFDDPIVRFDDATYSEQDKMYHFDMPHRHGGTVSQSICFLNGKPLFVYEENDYGIYGNVKVASFISGDKYDKATNKIKNEVSLEEWNNAFDIDKFVMQKKAVMDCGFGPIIVDRGTVSFCDNQIYPFDSVSFEYMTIKNYQDEEVTGYFAEISIEYEGEIFKQYINIYGLFYGLGYQKLNMTDFTYDVTNYFYIDNNGNKVCFIDGNIFNLFDLLYIYCL